MKLMVETAIQPKLLAINNCLIISALFPNQTCEYININNQGVEYSHGEENGNPLQYCCLENPMDTEAWLATVHRVAESDMTIVT